MTMAALRSDACAGKTITLAGPKAYTTKEVIELCEKLSDSDANVTTVPTWALKAARNVLQGAQWARDAADRLVGGVGAPVARHWDSSGMQGSPSGGAGAHLSGSGSHLRPRA